MNREEKREFIKKLQKKGASKDAAKRFVEKITSNSQNPRYAFEGEKVKIDYVRLISYPDWDTNYSEDYKRWITAHKDDVFTVEFDPIKKEKNNKTINVLVQLKEDETNPKWLFWAGDLIPQHSDSYMKLKLYEALNREEVLEKVNEKRIEKAKKDLLDNK